MVGVRGVDLLTANDRDKAVVGVVGGGNPRLTTSCIQKGEQSRVYEKANNLVYTKRRKDIYAIRKHETTNF